jgi:hypothetical protein
MSTGARRAMDNDEVVNQDDDAMNANRKPASRRVDDVNTSASPSEDGRANEPGTLQQVKETDIQTTRLLEHAVSAFFHSSMSLYRCRKNRLIAHYNRPL